MLTKDEFQKLLTDGPVLLDGATGSNLQKMGMPRGCCSEEWILANPEKLVALQRQYAQAGSKILYAPTFQAQPIALERVGLANRARHLPTELSGGQQQRVAIARAIVTNPKLILADEPTGALDSKTSQEIIDIFHELHEQGNTIVLITHDNDVAKQASRSIHILDGKITEVRL